MNVLINDKIVDRCSLGLRLGDLVVDLCLVYLRDLGVQALHDFFSYSVGAECDAELVTGAVNHVVECFFNFVVNLVHTEVQVLDLRVLDRNPLFNLFAFLVDSFN